MSDISDQSKYYERMIDEIADAHIDQLKAENAKVHERLIRCKECDHCHEATSRGSGEVRYECRRNVYSRHYTEPDGFCHRATPRARDA